LTPKDWKKLRTIKEFLEPFIRATLAAEGSTSLDSTLFIIDILIKYLQEENISSPFPLYDYTNSNRLNIRRVRIQRGETSFIESRQHTRFWMIII
jgi:hypothetical protein